MTDDTPDFRRLREVWLQYEKLIALPVHMRTAEQNAQLYDAALYLAEFYGRRPYHGAKATCPDAGEPDHENSAL